MKTLTMSSLVAAAALAATAGSASAQTMLAEIPVTFQVGKAVMAPGSYQVRTAVDSGTEIVYLRNLDTHRSVLLASAVKSDAPHAWAQDGVPRLSFECFGSVCALRRMWNGPGSLILNFPAPKIAARNIEARRTLTVVATR